MLRIRLLLMAAALLAVALPAHGELARVADGVYAYLAVPPGTPGNVYAANVGVVVGEDAVLVVDTLTSAEEARVLLEDIRRLTGKPVRWVVNTHSHLDHSMGNSVFAEQGAVIVGHERCRERILSTGPQTLAHPERWWLPADFFQHTRIAAPSVTFADRLDLDLGDMPVRLLHLGPATHTPGSIVVALPGRGVLFTGDILFTDFHPFLGEGDLAGWMRTLALLEAMDYATIVPGHGPLASAADLREMHGYLERFVRLAAELCPGMTDPDGVAARMLSRLPERSHGAPLVNRNVRMLCMPGN